MYRNRQIQQIFILKSLSGLKINKRRTEINETIKKYENRSKYFLIWPLVDLYEWYEHFKTNRGSNTKS